VSLHEIALKNNFDELVTLSEWVDQLSGQLGLSPQCAFRLDLVLTEAVTNIIENAYVDEQAHDITVTLQYEDNRAKIQLKDDGVPFDPLQKPELVLPKSLEEAAEGGLGIHLIRRYTDECQYYRLSHENVLTFVINNV
jgi:serine/threonine-protein kinase RsbW